MTGDLARTLLACAAVSCAWPRCKTSTRPGWLMCRGHWYTLPKVFRDQIWEHYRPGQDAGTASPEYIGALAVVLDWALAYQEQRDAAAERLAGMQRRQETLW